MTLRFVSDEERIEQQRALIHEVYDALLEAKGLAHDGTRKGQHKYAASSSCMPHKKTGQL